MIGKTLGHYQITGQLGKGGMGEVFQAKDQVLGRDVAIKILPEEFADVPLSGWIGTGKKNRWALRPISISSPGSRLTAHAWHRLFWAITTTSGFGTWPAKP